MSTDTTSNQPEHPPAELLRFEGVQVGYGRRRVLSEVSFSLARGDYVAFVGSNGSGKTSLLRVLLGLLRPQRGRMAITSARPLHFGYVPQLQTVDEIFPISVLDVVLMGRYGRIGAMHRINARDREVAMEALSEVGIADLAPRLYREMSGGQKQRALIARALASEPDVLVLDEHTNDLDIGAEKAIMALIDRLHAERALAVVMVSHSLNTVANHASRIGLIREGSLHMESVETVMQTEYLKNLYNMDMRVVEVDGARVII